MTNPPCEIWGIDTIAACSTDLDRDRYRDCPRCGEFRIFESAIAAIERLDRESPEIARISAWIREQNSLGEFPIITTDRIERILCSSLLGIQERADRFLAGAVRKISTLYERVHLGDPALIALSYSKNADEVSYLAKFLEGQGFFRLIGPANKQAEVTPRGHLRNEELNARQVASTQGFVAMWFDESMREAYHSGFETGIREAGYDPVRVDRVEHVGKIDDEIIAQVRKSRFVVADFTGHRGGVYFEAGFALGLNLPVFWTCRKNDITALHFDIRQFNCIDWSEPGELAHRLQKRIEAVIGAGPRTPINLG